MSFGSEDTVNCAAKDSARPSILQNTKIASRKKNLTRDFLSTMKGKPGRF